MEASTAGGQRPCRRPGLALRTVGEGGRRRQRLLVTCESHIVEMELDGTFVRNIGSIGASRRTSTGRTRRGTARRPADYLAPTAVAALPLSGHIAAVDSNSCQVRIFDTINGAMAQVLMLACLYDSRAKLLLRRRRLPLAVSISFHH